MKQLRKHEVKRAITKQFKREKEIILVLENIQYARNVASMFRTADAAGVNKLYLTGISHRPPFGKELRQASRSKENSVHWEYKESTSEVITYLKREGFEIMPIELTDDYVLVRDLPEYLEGKDKVAFIAGSEVFGVTKTTLESCDKAVLIPMYGKGASLNVSSSVAAVLFAI
ncbi:MAG: TrmH family RNA methyltransferase [Candidatus Dojkabacteria bacterium]